MEKHLLTADTIVLQDTLRQVEALCTQSQSPACTAACPLHLDAREFCRLVAEQDMAGAFKLYQKAVPFARLVARTCDAPCMGACKREQVGGAIQMQLLEQFVCQAQGKAEKPPMLLGKKTQRAAIVGGGLRGMAAAAHLARKGYGVTIFEKTDALGGALRVLPEHVMPPALLEEEIGLLAALRVQVQCDAELPLESPQAVWDALPAETDAAFVACASPLDALADKDSLLVAGQTALLAGRRAGRMTNGHSTVYDVYDGRSAAVSMDRLFQKVSLLSGREKEGSHQTLLFTSLEGMAASPPVAPEAAGFSKQQAVAEAGRCIQCQCLECVKKCGFMQAYGGDPSRYVREVYNNLSIAMGTHHANKMINTCALCSQCEAVCPLGLDMQQVFLAARQRMVVSKKMPPSAHEFALEDMENSLSDECYLLRHQPGHQSSAVLFFPGCQLEASEPELVKAAWNMLCGRTEGGCGLWLGCCGVMAHWSGEEERFAAVREKLVAGWERMGRPTVIAACPTCQATLAERMGIEVMGLFEWLEQEGLSAGGRADLPQGIVLHHACGARHRPALRQSVQSLCATAGILLQPQDAPEEQAPCCGYGGLVPFVDEAVAGRITEVTLEQLAPGKMAPVLTYCVNCRDRYLAQGRSAWHLLEVLLPDVPRMRHAPPTWSERRQNRAALQDELLREAWQEQREKKTMISLCMEPGLEEKLQQTHVLHSDIAAAIGQAEAEGSMLVDEKTGRRVVSHRPRNVTFWVEYRPEADGYRVYNAWCHRMQAVLTDKLTESGAQTNG